MRCDAEKRKILKQFRSNFDNKKIFTTGFRLFITWTQKCPADETAKWTSNFLGLMKVMGSTPRQARCYLWFASAAMKAP